MSTPDLAPGAPSRELLIDAVAFGEGTPTSGTITFILPCDLRILSTGQLLTAGSISVPLTDGGGTIRVPTVSAAVTDDAGDQWVIIVKKSWEKRPYGIRVPAGSGTINLGDIAPARPLKGRELQWAVTAASMTVTQVGPTVPASGTVSLSGGVLDFRVNIPQGQKGDPGADGADTIGEVEGLQAALNAKMNVAATGIVNTDLNGLFTPGVYSQGSSTTAANPDLHYPAPYACRILVMASPTQNQVTQVVWTYFATTQSQMFWRSFISGAWGPWQRVFTAAEAAPMQASLTALTYKSGSIDLTANLDPAPVSGALTIERRGGTSWLNFAALLPAGSGAVTYTDVIPTGFQANEPSDFDLPQHTTADAANATVRTFGSTLVIFGQEETKTIRGRVSWPTDQPLPA